MSIELTKKPLEISKVRSTVETITIPLDEAALRERLQQLGVGEAVAILWQVERIRCGKWADGAFSFPDDGALRMEHVLELRIFNKDSELHLRRRNDHLAGRFRRDEAGDEEEYVDSISRLWGERVDADENWITLRDADRKLELRLPVTEELEKVLKSEQREKSDERKLNFTGLVTRSYIGTHEKTGQAGYIDHRYHSIVPANMEVETDG